MAHISEDIRLKRKQVPLTQKELAFKIGVSTTTINKIENGSEKINLDILIRICEFLDYKLKLRMVKIK